MPVKECLRIRADYINNLTILITHVITGFVIWLYSLSYLKRWIYFLHPLILTFVNDQLKPTECLYVQVD